MARWLKSILGLIAPIAIAILLFQNCSQLMKEVSFGAKNGQPYEGETDSSVDLAGSIPVVPDLADRTEQPELPILTNPQTLCSQATGQRNIRSVNTGLHPTQNNPIVEVAYNTPPNGFLPSTVRYLSLDWTGQPNTLATNSPLVGTSVTLRQIQFVTIRVGEQDQNQARATIYDSRTLSQQIEILRCN